VPQRLLILIEPLKRFREAISASRHRAEAAVRMRADLSGDRVFESRSKTGLVLEGELNKSVTAVDTQLGADVVTVILDRANADT
jgi:hypothetical protein